MTRSRTARARTVGGDATKLAEAQAYITSGDSARANGQFKTAVSYYKSAMAKAGDAVN